MTDTETSITTDDTTSPTENLETSTTTTSTESTLSSSRDELVKDDTITQDTIPPSVDLSTPHRLQHRWSLWYDNPGKRTSTASWADHLKMIVSFDTVEDFWRVFNNIKPASELPPGSNYHLFKDPIEPKWEDEANMNGGKWVVPVPKNPHLKATDQYWLWAVLACIGEGIEYADEVTGIVISIRRAQDRLSLWTRDARSEFTVKNMGRSLKRILEIPDQSSIGYAVHSDAIKNSKTQKDRYTV
eukprot:TRINITY_DN1089_c0_g1_i1.p1 TRINITY_DN1089_c0_g1~~TRINITY_DN1089_c0_g1_i1.p1  ORF type:complete len:243 (+),score=36.65 TRINITY_DN1089_c0_g1_i1:436-1164(+)